MKSKFLFYYNKLTIEIKSAFWYTICNILVKGLAFITVPIFTRLLTEAEYGVVSVYQGWHDIFFIFGTLNLFYAVYNNAMLKYSNDIYGFTSSMIILIDSLALFFFGIYIALRNWLAGILGISSVLIAVIFIEMITVPALYFWMAMQRFSFQYRKVVAATLFTSLCSTILSIFLIAHTKNHAAGKIIGAALPNILLGLILCLWFWYKGKTFVKKEYWFYALRFNIPLIPHYLSGTVLNQSDRIMIARLVSDSKAGIYNLAYSVSFALSLLTSAINNSLVPWIYQQMKEQKYKAIKKHTVILLACLAGVLNLFILVAPEMIVLLAPPVYVEALNIIPPLTISVFFQFLYGLFGSVEFYFERTTYVTFASVSASLTNIIANFIFIPKYGYYAAAYTTLFCFIIMSVSHYFFLKITLAKEKLRMYMFDIRKIILVSSVFLLTGLGEVLLYSRIIIRYTIIIVALVLFLIKRKSIVSILSLK